MKNLTTLSALAAILSLHALPASAKEEITRVLFVAGYSDAEAKSSLLSHDTLRHGLEPSDLWHASKTYVAIEHLPEGRGPIDGVVDLKAFSKSDYPLLNAQISIFEGGWNANDRQFIGPNDPRVTEFSVVYKNSTIVGFKFAMAPKPTVEGKCDLGFHSASGDQDGLVVVFKEDHGDDTLCLDRDWNKEAFGQAVHRFEFGEEVEKETKSGDHVLANTDYTLSPGPRCYWMENTTLEYHWVDAPQGDIDILACKAQDGCDRIDDKRGLSGKGCYKFASERLAPGMAWPEE